MDRLGKRMETVPWQRANLHKGALFTIVAYHLGQLEIKTDSTGTSRHWTWSHRHAEAASDLLSYRSRCSWPKFIVVGDENGWMYINIRYRRYWSMKSSSPNLLEAEPLKTMLCLLWYCKGVTHHEITIIQHLLTINRRSWELLFLKELLTQKITAADVKFWFIRDNSATCLTGLTIRVSPLSSGGKHTLASLSITIT